MIIYLFEISKNKALLYIGSRLFYYLRFFYIYTSIFLQIVLVNRKEYIFTKSKNLFINTLIKRTVQKQNEKNSTNDWISRNLIKLLTRTLPVIFFSFSNILSYNLAIKPFIFILILKTTTFILSTSLKLFLNYIKYCYKLIYVINQHTIKIQN